MNRTKLLFGCYRKTEANDPEVLAAAVAATLAEFPREIVDFVTDPRTGLPATSKWIPSVFEVREACDRRLEVVENKRKLRALGYVQQRDGRWKKPDIAS
jgi:hypothetical protein